MTPVATTAERVDQSRHTSSRRRASRRCCDAAGRQGASKRALVFTRTKHGADRVVRRPRRRPASRAAAIHGNKSQTQRERALADFKAGRCRVLVATDIAARGIDIDGVTHVVNYDLPNVPESYVHRIGRTARAGAEGIAISFCDREERAFLRDIERLTRQKVPVVEAPADLPHVPDGRRFASPCPSAAIRAAAVAPMAAATRVAAASAAAMAQATVAAATSGARRARAAPPTSDPHGRGSRTGPRAARRRVRWAARNWWEKDGASGKRPDARLPGASGPEPGGRSFRPAGENRSGSGRDGRRADSSGR